MTLVDALDESLRTGLLFGRHDEPLDDYGKRIVRIILKMAANDQPDSVFEEVVVEVMRAEAKHKPINGPHEGYAVILEEVDELWEHVKADTGRSREARKEALQVAAMGLRYIMNVCDHATPSNDRATSSTV